MPNSSNDQQLLSQPGIQHVEFGGRPLDGTYRLTIHSSPDLNWSALEDIQLVINYEYWSQIKDTSGNESRLHPNALRRVPLKPLFKKAFQTTRR
jgi:hypothetical protein